MYNSFNYLDDGKIPKSTEVFSNLTTLKLQFGRITKSLVSSGNDASFPQKISAIIEEMDYFVKKRLLMCMNYQDLFSKGDDNGIRQKIE